MRTALLRLRHQSLVPGAVAATVGTVGLIIWWPDLETADRVASIGSFAVAALTMLVAVFGRRGTREPRSLAERQAALRAAVRQQWRVEEALRRVQDPAPIPVRWAPVGAALGVQDHWVNVRVAGPVSGDSGHPDRGGHEPVAVAGRIVEVAEVFRRIPSRRLVVLGAAGGGKSVLLIRLVSDLIDDGRPDDPVPVLLSLTTWDARRHGFVDWLTARLIAEYPALAAPDGDFDSTAAALVADRRILPALDGFDELPVLVRRAALLALNAAAPRLPGFVLTSRVDQYVDAVRDSDVLTGAAVVRLLPLRWADLAAYLPRTTRPTGPDLAGKWDPVLARLRAVTDEEMPDPPEPGDPIGGRDQRQARILAAVLATPLLTSLARAEYSDTGADPTELLDPHRFGTVRDLVDHLLDRAVPVAYAGHRGAPVGADVARVTSWLAWLARHGGPDIAWWRLSTVPPRAVSATVGALAGGIGLGLVAGSAAGLPVAGLGAAIGALAAAFVMVRLPLTPTGLRGGPHSGRRRPATRPVRPRFRPTYGSLGWLTGGVALVAAGWLAAGGRAAVVGATALLLAWALDAWLDVPTDVTAAAGPLAVLRADRRAALLRASARGGIIGCPVAVLVDIRTGLAVTAAVALASVLFTAWGRFAVARAWFALRGELPIRLIGFLDDAHHRGVLRQIGGVYQFRHARLRERLLTSSPDATGGPR
ncbi:NACHT domain-containing protein [Micromonospora sp. NPDC049047]|uniref:NACHT domain-containing protein n=1 Tax=Micromonospora sp. NPDC049047 TaxID=3155645 RepID=UPI0033D6F17D